MPMPTSPERDRERFHMPTHINSELKIFHLQVTGTVKDGSGVTHYKVNHATYTLAPSFIKFSVTSGAKMYIYGDRDGVV